MPFTAAEHAAWIAARRKAPYRVTITFELDNPDVNMCEGQRHRIPGTRYTDVTDYSEQRHALAAIDYARGGAGDTMSEYVVKIDAWRWGKRRGGGEGWSALRKTIDGRKRLAPVDPGQLAAVRVYLRAERDHDAGLLVPANGPAYGSQPGAAAL